MSELVIRNGLIITETGRLEADIKIVDEKISEIGRNLRVTSKSTKEINAECDVSLLHKSNDNQDKIKLLSFLTQMDCRKISDEKKNEFANYYKSLRHKNKNTIPHPATLFIL